MKYLKKHLIICLLTFVVAMSAPVKSHAFISDLISIIKGVSSAIDKASRAIKWANMTREVMAYPNEYIKEVNAILDDIEMLKQVVRQAHLSVSDMKKFLDLAQQYVKAIQSSLTEFQGIVNMVGEVSDILSGDMGGTVNLEELYQRIKDAHKINMDALAGAKRIVNNTKALISSVHAANTVVNASKQLK